jgi:CHAT domain-containing protein
LWAVADVATGLLMGKAYELLQAGVGKVEALREAQLWLRDLTAAEVRRRYLRLQAAAAGQPTQAVAHWRSWHGWRWHSCCPSSVASR